MSAVIPNLYTSFLGAASQTAFIGDVEKHIDDYKKGKGNLSKHTAAELNSRDDAVSIQLANTNVKALQLYSGYGAAFSYDKRARFVEGTSYSVSQIVKVANLYQQL